MSIKQEFKDRLLKFETLHGLYLVPLGLGGLFITIYHFQYVLHAIAALIFMYATVEGLRLIGYNPMKKAAKIFKDREKYL